jgi:hypothetical protein
MAKIKYLEAIGREVKRGRPPVGKAPSKAELIKLYIQEDRSVRDVAAALGCSKDMVIRTLAKLGISVRSCARRSKLRVLPLKNLQDSIKEKGIRQTAREIGVCEGTLRHHMKGRTDSK